MRINPCDMCSGQNQILGSLANMVYLKCRNCGWIEPKNAADLMETAEDEDALIYLDGAAENANDQALGGK